MAIHSSLEGAYEISNAKCTVFSNKIIIKKFFQNILCFVNILKCQMDTYICMAQLLPEKAMATHSSTLAWKIPWTEEPGRLQSIGSWRVGHDWAASISFFTFMHWRRKWEPTQVFLPGKSQGQGSLVGCPLWGCTESDTTEATSQQLQKLLHCSLGTINIVNQLYPSRK